MTNVAAAQEPASVESTDDHDPRDVFVSYSRADRAFVQWLSQALADRGRRTWVDWQNIPPSAEWMAEIRAAIDAANAFVLVLSPDSIGSRVCLEELDHAVAGNKRIIPILCRTVQDDVVPEAAAKLNWIDCRGEADASITAFLVALDSDLDRVRAHTKLLVRAREWEAMNQDASLLLRGNELRLAEELLETEGDPAPTPLQTRFVVASRHGATARGRRVIVAVTAAFLLAALLGVFAWVQRGAAVAQRDLATARELAATAVSELSTDPERGLLLAIRAAETSSNAETDAALRRALLSAHLERTLQYAQSVEAIAYTPDARRLVTAGTDGVVRVIDAGTGEQVLDFAASEEPIVALDVSPDGERIASGGLDGQAHIWDMASGEEFLSSNHEDWVQALDFSSDGRFLATGDGQGMVRILDAATGDHVLEVPHVGKRVYGVAFSPNGRVLATASDDGIGRIIDVATGDLVHSLRGHDAGLTDVSFDATGGLVATASGDRTAKIWDASSGRLIASLPHLSRVLTVAFSTDSVSIVTGDQVGVGRIWDVSSGSVITELVGHSSRITDTVINPGMDHVATASSDGTARIWRSGPTLPVANLASSDARRVIDAESTAGGEVLIAEAGRAILWDPDSGDVVHNFPNQLSSNGRDLGRLTWATVNDAGDRVLTVYEDGLATLWDVADDGRPIVLEASGVTFVHGVFSPDGRLVVTAGYGSSFLGARLGGENQLQLAGQAIVWDAETGQRLRIISELEGSVEATAVAPDGTLAILTQDGRIQLRPAEQLGSARVLDTGAGEGNGMVAFSPNGSLLASGGEGGALLLWDTRRGALVRRIQAHRGAVTGVAWAPSGRYVVTGGLDGAVRVWSPSDGNVIEEYQAAPGDVTGKAVNLKYVGADVFEPLRVDGGAHGVIIAATGIGLGRVYRCDLCVESASLLALARERVAEDLGVAERSRLLSE